MLFAESSASAEFIIIMVIMFFGIRQWAKWLGGNNAVGKSARKGIVNLMMRWIK